MLKMAAGPKLIHTPTRHDLKNRLMELSNITHLEMLSKLPSSGKISLALDCWTSTTQQAFLAITGYFIDNNWNHHEILVAFEPVSGSHEGRNLASIVVRALDAKKLSQRVLSITTDNASNNSTLMRSLVTILQEELYNRPLISSEALDPILRNLLRGEYHVPCLAHVIQLIVLAMLSTLRLEARNDNVDRTWNHDRDSALASSSGIPKALEKVI
jgi:hypothetical protein